MEKRKILIIDDEASIVKAYSEHLHRKGYDIDFALDGQEGFDKAKKFKPDLILLDIIMPGLDGISTLKKLRANRGTKKTPVIILTNLESREDIVEAMKEGSLYFVKANFALEKLDEWIEELLEDYAAR
jgi:two-component system, OmpR family, alkaline phosphatase synthesis response regulator PhoP